jgi:putative DNA primase/helicase
MSTASPARPNRPAPPQTFSIPRELIERPQWIVWKYALRDGDWTKVPYCPENPCRGAKANDSSTWATFDDAWAVYLAGGFDGIGYEFSADDPYFGADVDHCLEGGLVLEWAVPIVESLQQSYGEISPSGRGIKFIARGKLPGDTGAHRVNMGPDKTGGLELYERGRYFTITGNVFGDSSQIVELQDAANDLYRVAKERDKPTASSNGPASDPSEMPVPPRNGVSIEDRVIAYLGKTDPAISGQGGHDTTFRVACNVGPGFSLSPNDAFRLLWDHYNPRCQPPWSERDLRHKVEDAYQRETKRGWLLGDNSNGKSNAKTSSDSHKAAGTKPPSDLDKRLAKKPRTDLGNGERFAARFGADVRYCHPWKKWLRFDGQRWAIDDRAVIQRMAKAATRAILKEAAALDDHDDAKAHTQWWHASESKTRVEAMLSRASSEKGIPILPDEVDIDPYLLNVRNGTIDLRTGKLQPHRREDMITKLAPVEYVKGAFCPIWLRVLDEIFARDPGLIRFWQALCGICLTGDVSNQMLPVLWGSGANGKTTILTVLQEILGADYAATAPPGLLTVKRGERHPTEIAKLQGKRLVVSSETEEGARLNEQLVKQLTGGDILSARRMKEDFWDFKPSHKLLLCTNHKPEIHETKNAIWRRVKLVPFTISIPEDRQDAKLPERLRAEYPGILNWCVQGCLDWQENGLEIPGAVEDATQEYRRESDVIGEFLASECTVMAELRARATPLYARYQKWAGGDSVSQRKFGKAMAERGFKKHTNNGTEYLGVGLRPEANEAENSWAR